MCQAPTPVPRSRRRSDIGPRLSFHDTTSVEIQRCDGAEEKYKQSREIRVVEMRPPSPSLPEKDFFITALSQSLRIDGRSMLEMRKPVFTFGPELGWVECSLGKTKYIYNELSTLL